MSGFEVTCPHPDHLCSVSCPKSVEKDGDSGLRVEIVCNDCFADQKKAAALLSLPPLSEDHNCSECGRSPSRYRKAFMSALCDDCQGEQESILTLSFGAARKGRGREVPDEIYDGKVFLGSEHSATNTGALDSLGISHILVCGNGLGLSYSDENRFRYHQLPIDDSLDQNIVLYIPQAVQFIDHALSNNGRVLVHCQAGISRSASIVIAWAMWQWRWDYYQAYHYVKSRRQRICPNSTFVRALQEHWHPVVAASPNESRSSSMSPPSLPASSTLKLRRFSSDSLLPRDSPRVPQFEDLEERDSDCILALKGSDDDEDDARSDGKK